MSLLDALTLFVVMLPLAALPSSSVALVVARSVGAGRRSGAVAALGIVAGDLIFVAMALLGLSVLAEWLGAFFSVVKYGAGAYLIWLGVGLLRSRPSLKFAGAGGRNGSSVADFLAGLLLTLGDVKAIFFYASLFPTLVDMNQVGIWDAVNIAAITAVTVGGVKLAYACFAARIVDKLHNRVSSDIPRKLGGSLLIGCGSVLIVKA